MVRLFLTVGLSCTLALIAVPGFAQNGQTDQTNQRTRTAGEVAAGTFAWGHDLSYVRDHFVKAAEEFPEAKYSYRPTEDVRTFGEIVLHVARYNHLTAAHAMERQSEDVREFAFHSKAEAVAKLRNHSRNWRKWSSKSLTNSTSMCSYMRANTTATWRFTTA